jgi:hypothetical protein
VNVDYAAVLTALYPGQRFDLIGDDYSNIVWMGDVPLPTQNELDDAWPTVRNQRLNLLAEQQRNRAYQAEADPLFFRWQAGEGTQDDWLAKRAQIRERYPYVEVATGWQVVDGTITPPEPDELEDTPGDDI